jgi:hypothetical protein
MITNKPKATQEILEAGESYMTLFQTEFGNVYLIANKPILVCEFVTEYVPIDNFQEVFLKMSEFVKQYAIKKIIFDKRVLTTFHQPSMEWYFIVWKKEMLELGLKTHRKILPDGAPWFKKAVEAGHQSIKRNNPNNIINQLDIAYRDDMATAIAD